MKFHSLLLVLMFSLTTLAWVQESPSSPQAPAPGSGRGQHHQEMMQMHKEEVAAMKADVEKLKSSLAEMKANILTIKEPNELARWRNNVDMWETLVGHMDRMLKHMETMGPGMMGHEMGGPPPTEKKPE